MISVLVLPSAVRRATPGGPHPDPGQRQESRGNCGNQRDQLSVEVVYPGLQCLPAAGQSPQRELDR
jgi:hypothetical protein